MALAALQKLKGQQMVEPAQDALQEQQTEPEQPEGEQDEQLSENEASGEQKEMSLLDTIKRLMIVKQQPSEIIVNVPPIQMPEIIINVPPQMPPIVTVQVPETEMIIERDDTGLMKKVTKKRVSQSNA